LKTFQSSIKQSTNKGGEKGTKWKDEDFKQARLLQGMTTNQVPNFPSISNKERGKSLKARLA
jgi:hypothetical protein